MAKEEDASGGGDIIDFVLYMFVLGPAVEWCLKSPRVNRGGKPGSAAGIALAVLLLAAIAGAKLSWEFFGRDLNHFETLGVSVDAPSADIKRAYKQISLKYHPDKNPDDPNAATKFIKYVSAYEVLKDSTKRDVYNKFGLAGLEDKSLPSDTMSQLWQLSLFYVIWLVVGFLLTMGKASEDGRTWAFSGLLCLAVFEYQTKVLGVDYLAPIFPYWTTFEKVEILHKLFPPFMHGARMISQVIFTDIAIVNKLRLEEMHIKVDELFKNIIHVNNGSKPEDPAKALAGSAAGGGAGGEDVDINSKDRMDGLNTLGLETAKRLQERNQLPEVEVPQAAPRAAAAALPNAAAGGAAGVGGQLSAEAAKAAQQASIDAAAEAARNQSRLTNVAVFFAVYAAFKYAADHELI